MDPTSQCDTVRKDLLRIVEQRSTLWKQVFVRNTVRLEDRLCWTKNESNSVLLINCVQDQECALLAASFYSCPIVLLDDEGHVSTYLPYITIPGKFEMSLLHVNEINGKM